MQVELTHITSSDSVLFQILELLKLNIAPTAILQIIKTMR